MPVLNQKAFADTSCSSSIACIVLPVYRNFNVVRRFRGSQQNCFYFYLFLYSSAGFPHCSIVWIIIWTSWEWYKSSHAQVNALCPPLSSRAAEWRIENEELRMKKWEWRSEMSDCARICCYYLKTSHHDRWLRPDRFKVQLLYEGEFTIVRFDCSANLLSHWNY